MERFDVLPWSLWFEFRNIKMVLENEFRKNLITKLQT